MGDRYVCLMFPVVNGRFSGALNVAYKLAHSLVERGVAFKVVDYPDGLLYKSLLEESIEFEFIDLSFNNWDSCISSADVVFGFNNDIYNYPYFFRSNPSVYFYDVYPPFWKRFLKPKGIDLPGRVKCVRSISRKGFFDEALAVMEVNSRTGIGREFCFVDEAVIPVVPVSVSLKSNLFSFQNAGPLRITYIGRSERWKLAPLAKLMRDLTSVTVGKEIFFNIVVSDVKAAVVILKDMGVDTSLFNIDFHENLDANALARVIESKTDIGYAMGTSALEFSARGVPTILADFSDKSFPDEYKYKWLFEVDGFTLGLNLADAENWGRLREGVSIKDALDAFFDNPAFFAESCYSYTNRFHSEDVNYSVLVELIRGSSFKVFELRCFNFFIFHFSQALRKILMGFRKYER